MSGKKPIIGITPAFDASDDRTYLYTNYHDSVILAGGIPLIFPMTDNNDILETLTLKCDGLILSGGPDIDPSNYGEENINCRTISKERDMLEFFVFKKALELRMPVFGICRGIQTINVAMGGTLYQDISKDIKREDPVFHNQKEPKTDTSHFIDIVPDSFIRLVFNSSKARVNSFHHQSVKDVAPGFKVTSLSSDNVIESIEYTKDVFITGVQWHPERMWKKDNDNLNIFRMFIDRCRILERWI